MGSALLRAKQGHSVVVPDDVDVNNVAAVSSPLGVALRRSKMQQEMRHANSGSSDEHGSSEIAAVSSPLGSALRRSKVRRGQSPLRGVLPVHEQ